MKTTSDHGFWASRPDRLALENDEVHVWCVALDKPASSVQSLLPTLSSEEIKRAEGIRFPKDRDRSIVSHGVLKIILGFYLDISPEKIRYHNNSFGKPSLEIEAQQNDLQFNVSHSHDLALFAISRNRQVGIDVEYIRPFVEMDQMIGRFFSSREQQALCLVSADQRLQTFLHYWTYKEANIKARGAGLAISLEQFDALDPGAKVSVGPDLRRDYQGISQWRTFELPTPFPDYVAALTVEETFAYRLSGWQWQE